MTTKEDRDNIRELRLMATEIERGEVDVLLVARAAVYAGMLLVGTTVSKKTHHPVANSQHRYFDVREKEWKNFAPPGQKVLHAGKVAEIAIACALWGDYNDRAQRRRRCEPIVGTSQGLFGWSVDRYKTAAVLADIDPGDPFQGLMPQEEACVRLHALPPLVNAARDPDRQLEGRIDVILPDETMKRTGHDVGQWMTWQSKHTVASFRVMGCDLPLDVKVQPDYDSNMEGIVVYE